MLRGCLQRTRWLAALCAIGLTISTLAPAAFAVEPGERLADPAQETRARALSAELRCLVCQNQSIDDSNAPLARDLRLLVREQITAGKSDADVMSYIVARYGAFVLLRPQLTLATALLWLTPVLLLAAAGAFLWSRRIPTEAPAQPLTADEQKRLDLLLTRKP
jgi:cytochrome c-type biogenesis protein CcmH